MPDPAPETLDLDALVAARDARLAHATRVLSADPHVVGIFLVGSLGASIADPYSDIDLLVVVESEHHADFVRRRREIPSSWPGFLFNEWMPGAQHCVSHFEPFGKMDIFYRDRDRLTASPWYGLPSRVLYDPRGTIAQLIERSRGLDFEVATEDVSHSISKGLAALHETIRRAKRGELTYAQTLLDEFRRHVMKADDWLSERTPSTTLYAKFDERGSQKVFGALRASYCPLEAGAILRAVADLGAMYRQQVIELHERFNVNRLLSNDLRAFEIAEAAFSLPEVRRAAPGR
ncbi:nucleotidyltransferase domain-containing protein [Devosia nitrariae]|uniref:Polymerase nucleotidyl transferase domain-containing protein n=1 Tax=Devosia nitrariae TaxID=2071872 RepID=A0ABQ5W5T5_9HYPH|nr:nucleotidyltransferase domain-containing protein [Devosia nitrariae]GLQ55166.1 hypothetical protein GCM10010862_24250 [Devosia nitrariae]